MRSLTAEQRECKTQRLIWTFELAGVPVSREQAEAALDDWLQEPRYLDANLQWVEGYP